MNTATVVLSEVGASGLDPAGREMGASTLSSSTSHDRRPLIGFGTCPLRTFGSSATTDV
jgi:hypothetical protein